MMASYLPNIITTPFSYGTDLLRSTLGSVSFGPALSVSKSAVTSLFSQIEVGTLTVTDSTTGTIRSYGKKIAKQHKKTTNGVNGVNGIGHGQKAGEVNKVELLVKKNTFWMRLFLFADMGFAEAYMLGEVECTDLTGFFQVSFSSFRDIGRLNRIADC
jgi:cyclopropane-fatty-acyl-phospholipid synthase